MEKIIVMIVNGLAKHAKVKLITVCLVLMIEWYLNKVFANVMKIMSGHIMKTDV